MPQRYIEAFKGISMRNKRNPWVICPLLSTQLISWNNALDLSDLLEFFIYIMNYFFQKMTIMANEYQEKMNIMTKIMVKYLIVEKLVFACSNWPVLSYLGVRFFFPFGKTSRNFQVAEIHPAYCCCEHLQSIVQNRIAASHGGASILPHGAPNWRCVFVASEFQVLGSEIQSKYQLPLNTSLN